MKEKTKNKENKKQKTQKGKTTQNKIWKKGRYEKINTNKETRDGKRGMRKRKRKRKEQ